jgi:dinuclear metal center YbgI/SA1388 family protein
MKVSQLIEIIDLISPFELAQSWDNVGLLLGDADDTVSGCMFAVDITDAVADEAIAAGCNTIVGYHPVVWDPLKRITRQGPRPIVYKLLSNKINVISVHTALDAAPGGVNDALACAVGIKNPEPLSDYVSRGAPDTYKIVVFVPARNVNDVSEAMFDAGAGQMGNYSNCGFKSSGEGSFLPLKGAKPAIGSPGRLEKVDEIRFETIVEGGRLEAVIDAMKRVHPYEMPAYDIIKLDLIEKRLGIGRFGALAQKRKFEEVVADIKKITGAPAIGFVGPRKKYVSSAAVCAGSCGSILNKVIACGCDIYVTGELKHHDALAASEAQLACLCLGHSFSERFILKTLKEKIAASAPDVSLKISRKDKDPIIWEV